MLAIIWMILLSIWFLTIKDGVWGIIIIWSFFLLIPQFKNLYKEWKIDKSWKETIEKAKDGDMVALVALQGHDIRLYDEITTKYKDQIATGKKRRSDEYYRQHPDAKVRMLESIILRYRTCGATVTPEMEKELNEWKARAARAN